jgi:hypothetical protein
MGDDSVPDLFEQMAQGFAAVQKTMEDLAPMMTDVYKTIEALDKRISRHDQVIDALREVAKRLYDEANVLRRRLDLGDLPPLDI